MGHTPSFDDRQKRWIHDATWKVAAQFDGLNNLSIHSIASLVSRSFNIVVNDITNHSLFWVDVAARQITMVLACRFTDMENEAIAKWCGVKEYSLERACDQHDNMVDEIFRELDISIPKRRVSMGTRDLSVLRSLYASSVDGGFSCQEDVMPSWTNQSSTRTLNRLKNFGLAELEADSKAHWWRITPAGREIIDNLHERARALGAEDERRRRARRERYKDVQTALAA